MKLIWGNITLIALVFIGCKKQENTGIIYGYEYFPVTEGHYRTFDVVDVFHDLDLSPQHDTNRYQIKEVVGEVIVDNEGDEAHKLMRYSRYSDTLDWKIKDVWTIKRTNVTAETVKENKRYIDMVFAIAYDRTWNGNALNNEASRECYYDHIYEPYALNGQQFDSTVVVEKENFQSFIDFRRSFAVYAHNIGCIYQVDKNLRIDNFDTTDIQKGSEVFYTLTDWGIE